MNTTESVNIQVDTLEKLGIGFDTTPKIQLALGDDDTGLQQQGDGKLAIYTNNQERMRIDNSGNVGIGTDSPDRKLHIKDSYGGMLGIEIENTKTTSYAAADIQLKSNENSTGQNWSIGANRYGFYLYDNAKSSYRLVTDTNGNVGIGTDSPSAKLHVNGKIVAETIEVQSIKIGNTLLQEEESGALKIQYGAYTLILRAGQIFIENRGDFSDGPGSIKLGSSYYEGAYPTLWADLQNNDKKTTKDLT